MKIVQTNSFSKAVRKLHANQKADLDTAVKAIMDNIRIGEEKLGDLAGIFVYKFRMVNQLMLLAYSYNENLITLNLLALGSHENFYRDVKKNLN